MVLLGEVRILLRLRYMEQWCKWCARWTENPEVLVQLKAAPQNNDYMVEWSKAAVCKTDWRNPRGGSNPSIVTHAEIAQLAEWMLHTH